MAAVVGDGAEHLAAGAMRHRMVHEQRGVGVLAAIEQIDAIGFHAGMFAGEGNGRLIAADGSARGHAKRIEVRVRAQRDHGGGDVEGLAAVLDQADMVEPRIVADRNDQRVVGLIGLRAVGCDVALDQRRAGVLAERSSERVNIAAGAEPPAI